MEISKGYLGRVLFFLYFCKQQFFEDGFRKKIQNTLHHIRTLSIR